MLVVVYCSKCTPRVLESTHNYEIRIINGSWSWYLPRLNDVVVSNTHCNKMVSMIFSTRPVCADVRAILSECLMNTCCIIDGFKSVGRSDRNFNPKGNCIVDTVLELLLKHVSYLDLYAWCLVKLSICVGDVILTHWSNSSECIWRCHTIERCGSLLGIESSQCLYHDMYPKGYASLRDAA